MITLSISLSLLDKRWHYTSSADRSATPPTRNREINVMKPVVSPECSNLEPLKTDNNAPTAQSCDDASEMQLSQNVRQMQQRARRQGPEQTARQMDRESLEHLEITTRKSRASHMTDKTADLRDVMVIPQPSESTSTVAPSSGATMSSSETSEKDQVLVEAHRLAEKKAEAQSLDFHDSSASKNPDQEKLHNEKYLVKSSSEYRKQMADSVHSLFAQVQKQDQEREQRLLEEERREAIDSPSGTGRPGSPALANTIESDDDEDWIVVPRKENRDP